ncbi:hypothetical protein PDE_06277 [Penicillium oxalicum 114-2]|uniref:Uncharacterized protein n=1 Tax=Penicillium oxalicum (strain 114-2 / CGMCC 5302) TaxID=933388 RepID=S8B980_PENO1|nr:hypothetical protein PDE_06277 [Penicillium oxalicum 114-2]
MVTAMRVKGQSDLTTGSMEKILASTQSHIKSGQRARAQEVDIKRSRQYHQKQHYLVITHLPQIIPRTEEDKGGGETFRSK